MRILQVLSQTGLTGSEVYAQKLTSYLHSRGHEVHAVSDSFHVPFEAKCTTLPFNAASFWARLKILWQLRRILRKNSFDVIHCHSRLAAKNIFRAGWGLKLPVVTTLHGVQHASWSKRLFNSYGDLVISVCKNLTIDLRQKTNLGSDQIKELANPIAAPARTSAESSSTHKSNSPLFIFAARNSGPKGERMRSLLHRQMEWWVQKFPNARWRILLHGLDENSFLAEYLKIFPQVSVIGQQVNLQKEFSEPGAVVIASGRTAAEAVLAGCQVLGLGEAGYVGPLTESTVVQHLESNFGDMGDLADVDSLRVTADLDFARRSPVEAHVFDKIKSHYDPARIFQEIENFYFATRFRKKIAAIPILMYHRIPDRMLQTSHRTFVIKAQFQKHLQSFRRLGRTTMRFSELADFWYARRPLSKLPVNPVLLTFDDGYRDVLTNAEPLLRDAGMCATLFLLSRTDYDVNDWDDPLLGELSPLLSAEERKKLDLSVFEIGSHGHDHFDFTTLEDREIEKQMTESREKLARELSTEISVFAFPFGRRKDSFSRLAQKAGYQLAVNTDEGSEDFFEDPFSLCRVNIFPEETFWSLWKKTRPAYHRRSYLKRARALRRKLPDQAPLQS